MIPLVLMAGFLGAGKTRFLTTLIPQLLERGVRVRIVLNDFENAKIDAARLGVLQAGPVESPFIAKVVVHRGDVGVGPRADVAYRYRVEAAFGEQTRGRGEQPLAGLDVAFVDLTHSVRLNSIVAAPMVTTENASR